MHVASVTSGASARHAVKNPGPDLRSGLCGLAQARAGTHLVVLAVTPADIPET